MAHCAKFHDAIASHAHLQNPKRYSLYSFSLFSCVRHVHDRDFKIQDATASRTRWLINGLELERRRLRGKSKVKIPVWI